MFALSVLDATGGQDTASDDVPVLYYPAQVTVVTSRRTQREREREVVPVRWLPLD